MTIDAKTLPIGYPVYSFVGNDGENVHIDTNQLRLHCLKSPYEVFYAPIDPKVAKEMLRTNTISMERCKALTPQHRFTPIIFGSDSDVRINMNISPRKVVYESSVMLIDGHHRYVRAFLDKEKLIRAYMLTRAQWEPFRIVNYPEMTQEQLIAAPITPRNY